MDPISAFIMLGSAVVGTGLSLFGASKQEAAAKKSADASRAIAGYQQQQDEVRRHAMELDAQRKSTEVLRNIQRARSLGLAAATNQGASKGSGLQGGYGQISGQGETNLFGIQSSLGFGEQMFDLNRQINAQKYLLADAQTEAAQGAMYGGLGTSISNLGRTGPAISAFSKSFGRSGGGDPSSGGSGLYGGASDLY